MGRGRFIFEQMAEQSDFSPESVSAQPIVEIAGDKRILVENHLGVIAYGREKIVVNVKFGSVCICGHSLEMMHMTKEQLIIRGNIHSVTLQRRG